MSSIADQLRSILLPTRFRRGAKSLPAAKTGRGRVHVVPTRFGFIYLVMLAALLLGSLNHNNNLGYLLTFLLGSIAIVSIFHTYRNISGISVVSAGASPVFASQRAVFDCVIDRSSQARRAISFQFPAGEAVTADLPEESRQLVQVPLVTSGRGLLQPAGLFASTIFPLGLFRAGAFLSVDAACLVYPKPVASPMISGRGPEDEENTGETGGSGVEDFSGLDAYRPGDPLQHIFWKGYSRGQGLHTKKFEGRLGKTLYFDPDSLPGHDYELKLSRICYMILKADAMRIAYGLKLGSSVIRPETGERHKRHCLGELARSDEKRV